MKLIDTTNQLQYKIERRKADRIWKRVKFLALLSGNRFSKLRSLITITKEQLEESAQNCGFANTSEMLTQALKLANK